MMATDYRDDRSLADAIADVHREGMDSASWSEAYRIDERDYAMARADRLEAELAKVREALQRVFRDRREADKITAECLRVMPELCHTASERTT